jgi:hypothetical protein
VFDCFKQAIDEETSVPTGGTQPSDNRVPPNEGGVQLGIGGISCAIKNVVWIANGVLIITFLVSTLEHVEDEAIQEEKHMAASKNTLLSSATQASKEHSNALFINEILVIIIIIKYQFNISFLLQLMILTPPCNSLDFMSTRPGHQ